MTTDYHRNNALERASDSVLDEDMALVQEILGGSVDAWRTFVNLYSGLIYDVVRRFLFTRDQEEIRTLWADILEIFYNGELAKYKKCARLSTWLVVFTRARTIDYVRKQRGRHRDPVGFQHLSDFDRNVLQLFYVEKQSLDIVTQTLLWNEPEVNAQDVIDSIQRIEDVLGQRYLRKLDDEFHAMTPRLTSVRMLLYLIQQQTDHEQRDVNNRPDEMLIEKEVAELAQKVRDLVSRLPDDEQRVLNMRFDQNLSAKQISQRLDIGDQRKVYTILDRILRKLRTAVSTP
jgi:RNA polymerase sigma factor (sigma-70 family)